MITITTVRETHDKLCSEAKEIVKSKGHDYNRKQQEEGDTLYNLRVAVKLGIVNNECQSVLVRLSDKIMRLSSLTADPTAVAEVKDESIDDTIKDAINYLVYLRCFYVELTRSLREPEQRGATESGRNNKGSNQLSGKQISSGREDSEGIAAEE